MASVTAIDTPTLIGQTIYLEKLGIEHLADMHEYSATRKFYTYMELKPHKTIGETEHYLGKLLQRVGRSESIYWAICMHHSNKMIGTFGMLNIDGCNQSAQIGYGISPFYWNRGIFKEALTLVIQYGFNELALNILTAHTMLDNQSSVKGLLRLGFQKKEILTGYYTLSDGSQRDAILMERKNRKRIHRRDGFSDSYEVAS